MRAFSVFSFGKSGEGWSLLVRGHHCKLVTSSVYLKVLIGQVDLQALGVHSFRKGAPQQLLQRILGLHELGQGVLHQGQLRSPCITLSHTQGVRHGKKIDIKCVFCKFPQCLKMYLSHLLPQLLTNNFLPYTSGVFCVATFDLWLTRGTYATLILIFLI